MASMNRVTLIGNLGSDPEVRFTQGGQPVCNFRMATTETWERDGAKQESTVWHQIVVWGKQGEACGKHLAKGRQVAVEGRIATREYDDKDGNKRTAFEIVASNVVFLGKPEGGGGSSSGSSGGGGGSSSGSSGGSKKTDDDPIPF